MLQRHVLYNMPKQPSSHPSSILNNHRVIGIAANTSMVLNCALVTYVMMTADAGLPDAVLTSYPKTVHVTCFAILVPMLFFSYTSYYSAPKKSYS